MNLVMRDLHIERGRHALDRADLIDKRLFDVSRAVSDYPATAKAPQIIEPGMRADPNAVRLGL